MLSYTKMTFIISETSSFTLLSRCQIFLNFSSINVMVGIMYSWVVSKTFNVKNNSYKKCTNGGDSNNKPMAMPSWSMARSQCWTTVLIRTGSLSAPDINSTSDNQPWEKPAVGSQPGSIPLADLENLKGGCKEVNWMGVALPHPLIMTFVYLRVYSRCCWRT